MSKAGSKLIKSANQARAYARGEMSEGLYLFRKQLDSFVMGNSWAFDF